MLLLVHVKHVRNPAAKDAEAHIAAAEAVGDEDEGSTEKLDLAINEALDDPSLIDDWCCMSCILTLQSNFKSEKPLIQHYVEEHGHKCMFLPKFHCKLNPIEMVWGYAKFCKSH